MSRDRGGWDFLTEFGENKTSTPHKRTAPSAREERDRLLREELEARADRIEEIKKRYDQWMIDSLNPGTLEERRGDMQITAPSRPTLVTKGPVNKNTIVLETGENRNPASADRIFFVYVTPTGAEMPITRCPSLVKIGSHSFGGFEGNSRILTTEYAVRTPTLLKMVNIVSQLGSPKKVVNLFIKVSADEASICLYGLNKFGKFKGRGKVEYADSSYREVAKVVPVTMALLKKEFGFTLLQQPSKTGGKRTRSLMFD